MANRADLLKRFVATSVDRLRDLDNMLLQLERGPNAEMVKKLMREIHSLKGEARLLELMHVNNAAHFTEDMMVWSKDHGFHRAPDQAIGLIYDGLDLMTELFKNDQNQPPPQSDLDAVADYTAQVKEFLENPPELVAKEEEPEVAEDATAAANGGDGGGEEAQSGVLRIATTRMMQLTHKAGAIRLQQDDARKIVEDIDRLGGDWMKTIDVMESDFHDNAAAAAAFGNTVGAQLSRLRFLGRELVDRLARMNDNHFMSDIRMTEMEEDLAQLRLTQAGSLIGHYPSAIRGLAKSLGKSVRVQIEGADVVADKEVLDGINEPMMHLVRNSVDHGIEMPDVREKNDKDPIGKISITVRQAGAQVEFVVEDDGGGIDPDTVRKKLIDRQLLDADEVDRLTDDDALDWLFSPGFSTRDDVTDVSGRGVGLDVVRREIDGMGGSVALTSRPDEGSTFILRVPVSTAIRPVLLVRLPEGTFALASTAVRTVVNVPRDSLQQTGESLSLELEDEGHTRVPVVYLGNLLRLSPQVESDDGIAQIVVVSYRDRVLGLEVTKTLGERALVEHRVDPLVEGLDVVTGTSTLGGGDLVVFLLVEQLFRIFQTEGALRQKAVAQARATDDRKRILVVEDSDLTREMLVAALGKLSYVPIEAINGREGLRKLAINEVDLVLTDLDMPVLDGFGLIKEMRRDNRFDGIPIAVLSTRDTEEAKRKASQMGANAYLVKRSFGEGELRNTIEALLGNQA